MAKVVIRDARLSFPDLFEAVQFQGTGPFNYRATFLVEPNSESAVKLHAAIKQVANEKWGAKAQTYLPGILSNPQKICFLDGNLKAYNGYADMWALSASRSADDGAPVVVDRGKRRIEAKDGIMYAGCYVNATVEIWAQDNSYGKGIRATLVNVQFVKDGESFGGAAPASDSDLEDLGYDDDEGLV